MFRIVITIEKKEKITHMCMCSRYKQLNSMYLSQALNVQLAIIKSERIKTSKTVPGHIVIKVFKTNLVLNLILLKAPILLDEASKNNNKNRMVLIYLCIIILIDTNL